MTVKKPTLKTMKRITIATSSMILASIIAMFTSMGVEVNQNNKDKHNIKNNVVHQTKHTKDDVVTSTSSTGSKEQYILQKLRKKNLSTTTKKFDGVPYEVADEQDIVNLSRDFSIAIENYFKSCGASDWTNPYSYEFWPEDIEYMVTAIAFMESSYRTNVINEQGCGGLTGLKKDDILKTLGEQWLTKQVWGDSVPQVNCDPNQMDIFNGTTCIEYTYYNIGYNLANRLKKDKQFIDIDGTMRSVWDEIEYTEDKQLRLIIASHRYGLNNVIDSIFKRNYDKDGQLIPIHYYTHGAYVEGVLDKMVSLELKYGSNFNY